MKVLRTFLSVLTCLRRIVLPTHSLFSPAQRWLPYSIIIRLQNLFGMRGLYVPVPQRPALSLRSLRFIWECVCQKKKRNAFFARWLPIPVVFSIKMQIMKHLRLPVFWWGRAQVLPRWRCMSIKATAWPICTLPQKSWAEFVHLARAGFPTAILRRKTLPLQEFPSRRWTVLWILSVVLTVPKLHSF